MKNLKAVKEHFSYCIDNGLTIGEQEEKLLEALYLTIERQENELSAMSNKIHEISRIIEMKII